jgi:hypothetical protein
MSRASSSTSSYVGGASPSISVAKCWTFEFKVPSSADWVPSPAVVVRVIEATAVVSVRVGLQIPVYYWSVVTTIVHFPRNTG